MYIKRGNVRFTGMEIWNLDLHLAQVIHIARFEI
ncbi:hypothetical protein EC844_1497 [Acinetobacter calcoaceticus]|uniref:Uncharacterized protein n=1 Tax=Acinetobacter calcoaceticus TaxID=471 RepID=A0A4V2QZ31_ACICA|nr:hypothetical protein EC844_1497 [Acinetobacter calcoaceticus]